MRLAGSIKLGFYPTPDRIIEHLKNRLVPEHPGKLMTILDPCAGEGQSLLLVRGTLAHKTGLAPLAYAIEPDRQRYLNMKNTAADYQLQLCALNASMEDCQIAHNSFSLLWLNPPYDWQHDNQPTTGQDDKDKRNKTIRKEIFFLRRTYQYLAPGGLLIYIVPDHILTDNLKSYLHSRFSNLDAFRFPEPEYSDYKQIVITGTKKPQQQPEPTTLELRDYTDEAGPLPVPQTSACRLFRSNKPNPEEIAEILFPRLPELLAPITIKPNTAKLNSTPPLPLHIGHLSLLLAAGRINGLLGTGPDRHVVKGSVIKQKATKTETTTTEKGTCHTTTIRDTYTVSIKLLFPDGTIEALT